MCYPLTDLHNSESCYFPDHQYIDVTESRMTKRAIQSQERLLHFSVKVHKVH